MNSSPSIINGAPLSGRGFPPPSPGGEDIGTSGGGGFLSTSSSSNSGLSSQGVELDPLEKHAKEVVMKEREKDESLLERKRSTRSTRRRYGFLNCLGEESVDLSELFFFGLSFYLVSSINTGF